MKTFLFSLVMLWPIAALAEHETPAQLPTGSALSYQNVQGITRMDYNGGQIVIRQVTPGYSIVEMPDGQKIEVRETPTAPRELERPQLGPAPSPSWNGR